MTWTAARGHERCPLCCHRFAKDEPLALLTARNLKRCAPCVSPSPVDWDMVHLIIEAREELRTGEPVVNVRQAFERVVPGSLDLALKDYGIKGVRRSKPKPFSHVADHPD